MNGFHLGYTLTQETANSPAFARVGQRLGVHLNTTTDSWPLGEVDGARAVLGPQRLDRRGLSEFACRVLHHKVDRGGDGSSPSAWNRAGQ